MNAPNQDTTTPDTQARARLREAATKATPGPYEAMCLGSEGYAVVEAPSPSIKRRVRVAFCGQMDWDTDKANAAFIAAASPDVVLALLDRLDAVEKELGKNSPHTRTDAQDLRRAE